MTFGYGMTMIWAARTRLYWGQLSLLRFKRSILNESAPTLNAQFVGYLPEE